MLILFFTIVFIAELIISIWLISKIHKYCKQISSLNNQINEIRPIIIKNIIKEKEILTTFKAKVDNMTNFVDEKKHTIFKISPGLITTIASFILKKEWKKLILAIDVIMGIKKLLSK